MFPGSSEEELDIGFLRSGRTFRLGKRRKVTGDRRDYSFPREGAYGCESYLDEGSCDEEEEYSPISKRVELGGSAELPRIERDYSSPERFPRVRIGSPSCEPLLRTSSSSGETGVQGGPPTVLVNPVDSGNSVNNLDASIMARTDVRLPTFTGDGTEDPEKHWFLCEAIWMVHLVHNTDIKKGQMITTLRGHALDWFMNFYAVLDGTP